MMSTTFDHCTYCGVAVHEEDKRRKVQQIKALVERENNSKRLSQGILFSRSG